MSAVLQYMKAMALGMLAGLPAAVGVRLLCALRRRRSGARTTSLHEGLALFLLVWTLGLLSQTVLPELITAIREGTLRLNSRVNLVPFLVFRQTAEMFRSDHLSYFLINLLGNVLIFVPLGLLPPLLWKGMERFWKVLVLGCGLSVFIETAQLLLPRGTDIDDVWLNTLGAALGYGVFALIRKGFPKILPRCRVLPAAERSLHG